MYVPTARLGYDLPVGYQFYKKKKSTLARTPHLTSPLLGMFTIHPFILAALSVSLQPKESVSQSISQKKVYEIGLLLCFACLFMTCRYRMNQVKWI